MGLVKTPEEIERIEEAMRHPRFVSSEMLRVEFLSDPELLDRARSGIDKGKSAPYAWRAGFTSFADELATLITTDPNYHGQPIDLISCHTGTHTGPFQGFQPTGRSFRVRGMQISRFSDGKLIERWGSSDQLGILTQLGLPTS